MYDTSIILKLSEYPTDNTDEYGNLVTPNVTSKNVYAEVLSVGFKEFYEAAAHGFKPEIKFKLANKNDYNNAQQIEYKGVLHDVLRTYEPHNTQEIEITCAKGIN